MKKENLIANLFTKITERFSSTGSGSAASTGQSKREREVPPTSFSGSRGTVGPEEGAIDRVKKQVKIRDTLFARGGSDDLLEILKNNHPDVSQAVWNFKIIGNNGYKIKVFDLDGVTVQEEGQELLKIFLRDLEYYIGDGFEKSKSLDKVIDQLFDSILIRGAASLEMVLDESYTDVLYLTCVDPMTIEFRFEGDRLVPYQEETSLDIPTFFYEGMDESELDPYGTSPFASAVQSLAFHYEVLDDLKMVVHNQGYGKYDITIIEEVLLKRMPIPIRNNEEKKQKWLNDQLAAIIAMYSKLDPDAAFVHFDSVNVDMVEAGKATVDPEKIMSVIDTQILGALKQYSTLMGRRSTGQTEQYAKMEIKIFMKSVKRVQRVIESILSRALTRYLNFHGMQAYVEFRFNDAEIRTELEKVNFEQIAITNAARKRDEGWITQDEASEEVTGTSSVAEAPAGEGTGGENEPQGAPDEIQPTNPQSSDSTGADE